MACRISCCLNSISSQSSSPLLITKSQISGRRKEAETKPRETKFSFALGVTATIIISTIQISDVAVVEAVVTESPVHETVSRRWSEKRICPPWLENSLETIVPENLPRPSGPRRLELAGLDKSDAPPVGAVVTRGKRDACFSV